MRVWLVVALFAAAALSGCDRPASPSATDSPPPTAELAGTDLVMETTVREVAFEGRLEALNRSTVSSEVNARVIELPFDIGDAVARGDVVVRFRDTQQRAQLNAAQATLNEAEANLAEVAQTRRRAQALYDKELIARSELESAVAAFESARARVDAAAARMRGARERLEYTVVRAPYGGILLERHVEIGETATVGQPLLTGLSLEHLRAVVDIPQSYIAPLREHRRARVILPNGGSLDAASIRIPPGADPQTHTFRVRVRLPEGNHGVYPGTLVKVAFVYGEHERLFVPADAVVQRSEVVAVYVLHDDGRIELRQVLLGAADASGRRSVLAGLEAGERIALDPMAAGLARKRGAAAR